jgi:hypothetical protein
MTVGTILIMNVNVTQTVVRCYESRFFSFGIGDLLRKGARKELVYANWATD